MNYLILHGSFGSPQENWFTWLKLKLEEKGQKVYLPALPCDDYNNFKPEDQPRQSLQSWLNAVEPIIKEVEDTGYDLTIVAHSISPAFVLSLLDANPKLKVKKLIAVAPFLHHGKASEMWQFKKVNNSFLSSAEDIINNPIKLKAINNQVKETIVLFGDDDPYVENEQSIEYAQALGGQIIEVKSGGHLNAEAGYTEFEELLSLI